MDKRAKCYLELLRMVCSEISQKLTPEENKQLAEFISSMVTMAISIRQDSIIKFIQKFDGEEK